MMLPILPILPKLDVAFCKVEHAARTAQAAATADNRRTRGVTENIGMSIKQVSTAKQSCARAL
jgi:hypothetical protein